MGATNFNTRTEDASGQTKTADMGFTAEGDINILAYNGFMSLTAREGNLF